MTTPDRLLYEAINPALVLIINNCISDSRINEDTARVAMLAAAIQESDCAVRFQGGDGPARGYWQFEEGPQSATNLLMINPSSADTVKFLCKYFDIPWDAKKLHAALTWHDVFAAGMARMLYWCDPHPLELSQDLMYESYDRSWNPGKKRPKDWYRSYEIAYNEVIGVQFVA